MKFIVLSTLFAIAAAGTAISQTQLPPLPEELKVNATAVIRLATESFEIKNIGSATAKIKTIVTILNKKGDSEAIFKVAYDPYSKIGSLSGIITGNDGKIIKKLRKTDFSDYPAYDGSSFYSDLKVMAYEPVINSYPYTVEYEYEINYNGLLRYPIWIAQKDGEVAVENSSFEIITNNGINFRHSSNNVKAPLTSTDGSRKSTIWKVSDLKAYDYEPFSPNILEISPVVFTAPDEFEFHKTLGKMNSWENFGDWISSLNKGRDVLPESTMANVKQMVAGIQDTTEMIRKIYHFYRIKRGMLESSWAWEVISLCRPAMLTNWVMATVKHCPITCCLFSGVPALRVTTP